MEFFLIFFTFFHFLEVFLKVFKIIFSGGEIMKYPFEKQTDLKDCGVCCLLMLTRYYGGEVSKEYLRQITFTTKEGVSAYSLLEGAKILGFSGYGVKGDFKGLKKEDLPCIAHVVLIKVINTLSLFMISIIGIKKSS